MADRYWFLSGVRHTEAFVHFELEMETHGALTEVEMSRAFYFFNKGWEAYRDSQPLDSELAKSLAQDKDAPYG